MKKIIAGILMLSSVGFAQDLENFTTLKASGDIPKDFTELSADKFRADLASNEDKELDKDFFLSTRFFIDDLLLSGRFLFNEQLSDYLNKVARYTLRSEKGLYKELRFYVMKSTVVNAFSTDQGIIVFTTGLLAQLENEAQLAYIIAHEVSHYTEHHVREGYIEKQNLSKGVGKYERLDYESRVSQLSVYEKENELEADKKGVEIFLRTEYSVNEIFTSFEMLLYSYLPFDEIKFDPEFFNTDIMEIPEAFFPDTTHAVTLEEDYDDENSSHPNIKKRMDAVFDLLGDKKSRGDLKFQISESEFYKVRDLARFEGLNLLLADREYGKTLYNVYLLRQDYPDNRFLDLCFVKALYGLAKYKNANRYREVTEKPKNIEGESFLLHLFLYDLSREEINVIALRHAHDMSEKYPGDNAFLSYYEDLKKEFALRSRIDIEDLKASSFDDYMNGLEEKTLEFDIQDSIAKVDASELSKYQKIRLKKKLRAMESDLEEPAQTEDEFYKFALHDLVKSGLIAEIERITDNSEKESEEEKAREGISKVVVVDPIYQDYNLKNKKNFEKSERKKMNVAEAYTKTHRNLNMEVDLMDSKNLNTGDVAQYNQIGLVFQWLNEVAEHDDLQMISSMHDQMQSLATTYGTDQFLFTGIYAYKDRNEATINHFLYAFTIYGLPFVLADLLIIHNYFDMVSLSINAHTDEIEFIQVSEVNLKGTDKIIDAYIYDVLYQVKNGENNEE